MIKQNVLEAKPLTLADVDLGGLLGHGTLTVFLHPDHKDAAAVVGHRDDVLAELDILLVVPGVDDFF